MTHLEEAILEVYQTERERAGDPVRYPFENPHGAREYYERARRGQYIYTV